MKAIVAFLFPVIVFAGSAVGQTPPRSEVAFTYDWTRSNAPPSGCGCFSLNGGSGSFAFRFSKDFSAVAAIGAGSAGNVNGTLQGLTIVDFLAGVRIAPRVRPRVEPFAEVLAGAAHISGDLSPAQLGMGSATAFAFQPGGGIDLRVARRIAIRVVQVSYLLTLFSNGKTDHQNSFQMGTGIVLNF